MQNQKTNQKQRALKVYGKYQARSGKGVTIPEIRLCGKWLEENGFKIGKHVTVMHGSNQIIITTHA